MKTTILTTLMILTVSTVHAKNCGTEISQLRGLSSAAAEIRAQAVKDERIVIDRTSAEFKQLNAIGAVTPLDMKSFGSGFMVDSCHVLTNHHVVFEKASQAKLGTNIKFSVGQTNLKGKQFSHLLMEGKIIAFGDYDGTNISENADWAIIKLSKPVGEDVGSIPIYQMDIKQMAGQKIITGGYPGNRTNEGADLSRIYGDLNCKIVATGIVGNSYHTCQTSDGQSGSPLLAKSPKDGKYYAIAMADRRLDMTRSEDPNIANIAVNFTSGKKYDVISDGDKIMAALKADKCE